VAAALLQNFNKNFESAAIPAVPLLSFHHTLALFKKKKW